MTTTADLVPLPFSAPPTITPRRVAAASIALGAAVAAVPSIQWIDPARTSMGNGPASHFVVAFCTATLALGLSLLATNSRAQDKAFAWCALGGAAAGIANGGLSLASVLLIQRGNLGDALGGLILGQLVGGFYGAPLGFAYGLAMAIVVYAAVSARQRPTHDGLDRTASVAGVWLALVGIGCAWASTGPWHAVASGLTALIGLTVFIAARARLHGRRQFERAVRGGAHPAWVIVPRELCGPGADLVPLHPVRDDAAPAGVLALRRLAGARPYRDTTVSVPVALVELT